MRMHLGLFRCPSCAGELSVQGKVSCRSCSREFPVQDGIPLLFVPNEWDEKADVTEKMRAFYEETPFPNYENIDDTGNLIDKAERGLFARMLDRQTPLGTKVLEVGCGTGQLSNYLGIARRTIFGADLCLNSLRLANGFRARNSLERVGFYQMNLFRPIFKPESFDLVICNGVLHHTSDPEGGFQSIARLVKKSGYILIGLYNTYGRLITDARRMLFSLSRNRFTFLDPYLRRGEVDAVKRRTWFMDQYKNPHESKHTMGEVMKWFEAAGFEFQSGIPSPTLEPYDDTFRLFARHDKGGWLSHGLAQLTLVFTGSAEGGFFILIGKKT
jgi:SAM-dependent methyltransferase